MEGSPNGMAMVLNPALGGEVSEWFKETVLKTVVRETVPGVLISPSPPRAGRLLYPPPT